MIRKPRIPKQKKRKMPKLVNPGATSMQSGLPGQPKNPLSGLKMR
jgi:hypothetical protein